MVYRTARRGQYQGNDFWGCSTFPKCRGIVSETPPPAPEPSDEEQPGSADHSNVSAEGGRERRWGERITAAAVSVGRTVDKGYRWYLESDEPDATGRWEDDEHRLRVLRYVYNRDGGRCGLCAGDMKLKGAQIEHIVPKVFVFFDLRKGRKAVTGSHYESRLHKLDNLQAAHKYCNRRKGNTPEISKWRHPTMPGLVVADTNEGEALVVPYKPTEQTIRGRR